MGVDDDEDLKIISQHFGYVVDYSSIAVSQFVIILIEILYSLLHLKCNLYTNVPFYLLMMNDQLACMTLFSHINQLGLSWRTRKPQIFVPNYPTKFVANKFVGKVLDNAKILIYIIQQNCWQRFCWRN